VAVVVKLVVPTENLRAIRLAKEAADRDKPAEPKAKAKPKKKKST